MKWKAEVAKIVTYVEIFIAEGDDWDDAAIDAESQALLHTFDVDSDVDVQYDIVDMEKIEEPTINVAVDTDNRMEDVNANQIQLVINALEAFRQEPGVSQLVDPAIMDEADSAIRGLRPTPRPMPPYVPRFDKRGKPLPDKIYQPDPEKYENKKDPTFFWSSIEAGRSRWPDIPEEDWVCFAPFEAGEDIRLIR